MKIHDHSEALLALLLEGKPADEILPKCQAYLERVGQARLYPRILAETLALLEKRKEATVPVLALARPEDEKRLAAEIEAGLATLKATAPYTTTIDDTLIGGFTLETGHRRLDHSYKRQLLALYQSVTG